MIVRDENWIKENGMSIKCPHGGFISNRYLTQKDGMGFTLTKTTIPVNGIQFWHYKNHLEACICIKGKGLIRNNNTGEIYNITPGTMYALNSNDPHEFNAIEEVELICVFNPPLKGNEVHKEDGSYEL